MAEMNWNNVIPKHVIGWEDGHDGLAVLLVPRFKNGLLEKWFGRKINKPCIRVTLDEIGTFAWKKIDGQTKFESILTDMKTHFGSKVEPAEERLQKFFTILSKDKFVELFTKE